MQLQQTYSSKPKKGIVIVVTIQAISVFPYVTAKANKLVVENAHKSIKQKHLGFL